MTHRLRLMTYAAVGVVGAGLLIAQTAGFGQHPMAGMGRRAIENHLERAAAFLELTADQKAQARTIVDGALTQAQPLVAQLKQNRDAMARLVQSGDSAQFDQQLQKLADSQAAVLSKLIVIKGKAFSQVWALLTPDQRTKAEQLHKLLQPGLGPAGLVH